MEWDSRGREDGDHWRSPTQKSCPGRPSSSKATWRDGLGRCGLLEMQEVSFGFGRDFLVLELSLGNKLPSLCWKPSSHRMSLQWTAVATFLYAEVFAVLLLCIPFISPKRWQKIFKSRLVELVVTYGNTFFVVLIVILVLLVIDAVREIRKYDDVTEKVNLQNNPGAMEHFHMKLFRAQRNLYIAGFSLLLSFLLRRLVTLISQQATLLASNEAFKKQAESASEAAKKYMEENDQLKKGTAEDGGKLDVGNTEMKLEENKSLKNDVKKLKDELASTKKKLEKAENEALAMQKQSEGLTKEYDRLLEEHAKLQASVRGPSDKKEE